MAISVGSINTLFKFFIHIFVFEDHSSSLKSTVYIAFLARILINQNFSN